LPGLGQETVLAVASPPAFERAGHLVRGGPHAALLGHKERLRVARTVCVGSGGRTVAGRSARHRGDAAERADVERAGHLVRGGPGAVPLVDGERLGLVGFYE
jgi:hypothetical protein